MGIINKYFNKQSNTHKWDKHILVVNKDLLQTQRLWSINEWTGQPKRPTN